MIQSVGLLLYGVAAVGLMLTDRYALLVGCWLLGAVMLTGLIAGGRSLRVGTMAREAFLAEMVGGWALAIGSVVMVLALDLGRLDHLPWAGLGVVIAVAIRLGLPPLPWWPARTLGAPPAVRVFLMAGLHPVTAFILWRELEAWLVPWHFTLAVWLGTVGALLAIAVAAGERYAPRRAAWLAIAQWGGMLAAISPVDAMDAVGLLAGGLVLVHLQLAMPRLPLPWRRLLLLLGAAAVVLAAVLSGLTSPASLPALLRLPVMGLTVWIFWRWLREPGQPGTVAPGAVVRRPAVGILAPLARYGQGSGPLVAAVGAAARGLARVAADIDRLVLGGVSEGLGWMGVGAGWLVAWLDRRGLDGLDRGADLFLQHAGFAVTRMAAARPVMWAVLVILLLCAAGLARS